MIKIPIRAVGVVKNVVRVDSTTPLFSTHFGHEGKELVIGVDAFFHGGNYDRRNFPDEYRRIQSICWSGQVAVYDCNLGCKFGNFPEERSFL